MVTIRDVKLWAQSMHTRWKVPHLDVVLERLQQLRATHAYDILAHVITKRDLPYTSGIIFVKPSWPDTTPEKLAADLGMFVSDLLGDTRGEMIYDPATHELLAQGVVYRKAETDCHGVRSPGYTTKVILAPSDITIRLEHILRTQPQEVF